jgi:hypothetical protein
MFNPLKDSPHRETVTFGGSLFGYTSLVKDQVFVMLKGEGVPPLWAGLQVRLVADSRGYISGGFKDGESVTILGFRMPFEQGESDHIVEVTNGRFIALVKPSNIQRSALVGR